MTLIKLTSGSFTFTAKLEEDKAPETCAWFLNRLPMKLEMIQAAWSGMAVFSGLQGQGLEVPFEKATSYPGKGEVIMYPGDAKGNGGEIYIPYGGNCFACPTGQLAGNHFLTIIEGMDQLPEYGRHTRYKGAQEIVFEAMDV